MRLGVPETRDATRRHRQRGSRGRGPGGLGLPRLAPILQDMFSLKREVAATTRPDVCAAGEPTTAAAARRGMTASRLDSIFAKNKEGLAPLLKAVLAKKRDAPDVDALHPAAFDHPGGRSVEKQASSPRK